MFKLLKRLGLEFTLIAALGTGCTALQKTSVADIARRCDESAQSLTTADTPTKAAYLENLKSLQHNLEQSNGEVYIFINGYLEQAGKVEKGYWPYKTNVAAKDLAAVLSKHTGIAPKNASQPIPDYMEPEMVVKLASRVQTAFKQPPRGTTLSPIEADKEGYVPLSLSQIEAILTSSTHCGGGQFMYFDQNGIGAQLYTLDAHEQMKKGDAKQGYYNKRAPAYVLFVMSAKK